jgi:hypothetical protein
MLARGVNGPMAPSIGWMKDGELGTVGGGVRGMDLLSFLA